MSPDDDYFVFKGQTTRELFELIGIIQINPSCSTDLLPLYSESSLITQRIKISTYCFLLLSAKGAKDNFLSVTTTVFLDVDFASAELNQFNMH